MAEVSTRERAGVYDAIETAKPGEPIFTLQGGDRFAAQTILYWAGLVRGSAFDERDADKAAAMLRKATAAEEAAWTFAAYRRGELPEAEAPAAKAVLDAPTRDRVAALSAIADRIYDAVAELNDAASALDGMDDVPADSIAWLRATLPFLKDAVAMIEPRRHLQRRAS